jgi:23S rRNA pseudouridine1911/1915/1917 synthase
MLSYFSGGKVSTYHFAVKNITCERLFDYLKNKCRVSSRLFNKFKTQGSIYINDTPVEILSSLVYDKDEIRIELPEISENIIPEPMDLDIIYEDEYLLAVNKPANMIVHPTTYHFHGTLANGVAYYYASKKFALPIRPIIRLDKDTSGIVIFAKNALIQQNMIEQMAQDKIIKKYIAVVEGLPIPEESDICAPIARLPGSIITRYVENNGAFAKTHYKTIKHFKNYSQLEVSPKTGRTHQIRVHMQFIGHPILGDTLYGSKSELIGRQALHAYQYEFIHPILNHPVVLTAKLPEDISSLLKPENQWK